MLKKFGMGYTLHDTNSTPMSAIFIKSQIYVYSYLTIGPEDFYLPLPHQKKAAYLIVLQSQVLHRYKQRSASTLYILKSELLSSLLEVRPEFSWKLFFHPSPFLPSQMSYNWLPKASGTSQSTMDRSAIFGHLHSQIVNSPTVDQ